MTIGRTTNVVSDESVVIGLQKPVSSGERPCPGCGQPVGVGEMICSWCGRFRQTAVAGERPAFFQAKQVSAQTVRQSGLPVTETTYLALGGGVGSFIWVDTLRVSGVGVAQIRVIGREQTPYAHLQRLCRHSQISDDERIRSDSGARPDNLWGWPGYALEEIADLLKARQWRAAGRIAWQIFSEPVLAETYAPKAGRVFAAMEREMARIGWRQMVRPGEVQRVRQTDDGRYVVLYQTPAGEPQLVIAPYLHLAFGYPGVTLTAEAQAYRRSYGEWERVVQAYEAHERIYEHLGWQGGTVIVRGRGIVASRILQRLDEVRRCGGKGIQIIHLLNGPLTADTVYGFARRQRHFHRQVQPFNWPKAAFGGDLRVILEEASPAERQRLFETWGGTTTSNRRDWQAVVERGVREGWYTIRFGVVEQIKPNGRNRLIVQTRDYAPPHATGRLVADFVLDCTGLDVALANQPVLADLVDHYGLARNESGRLVVTEDFELAGLRNGRGRVYLAGMMAGGNGFAPVDSFLGLQYIARRSVDDLARLNGPRARWLDGRESLRQWWRWWQGIEP